MNEIQKLQQDIYHNYAKRVGLDPEAVYLHGTILRPVVPLDTGKKGLFILGAYPSARFALIDGISDVPTADNLGPFESERWFDGCRVRQQPSARELEELFLEPLSLQRSTCWITDLVKIFLFKQGHIERYKKLNAVVPSGYLREDFFDLAKKSLLWLEKELEAAQPVFMITLGAEVAGVLRGIRSKTAQIKLLKPEYSTLTVGSISVPVMHCAHPGILMRRNDSKNPWPSKHCHEFLPALEQARKDFGF